MLRDDAELTDIDQLTTLFRSSEKPNDQWRVGLEAEKFPVHAVSGQPVAYSGNEGIEGFFDHLCKNFGWQPQTEVDAGPVVSLERGHSSITLEPAAQFELSGAPAASLHEVSEELRQHHRELQALQTRFDVRFLHIGFHPWATHDDLAWVPKRRYPIMKDYLPRQGVRGLDMMRRTATVQVNLDYASEQDALTKLVVLLRLTPIIQAMLLHAPFIEGSRSPLLSERLDVWLNMDPMRSGLLLQLWEQKAPRYENYVEWALEAGMFLFLRDQRVVANTGQSFRSFMRDGYQGHRATFADWKLHLATLFPEVRLKNTLEVRCVDSLPPELAMVVPALLVGLVYDEQALDQAREVGARLTPHSAVDLQREINRRGLDAKLDGVPVRYWALKLLDIASTGLQRRALPGRGPVPSEADYLVPLVQLTEQGVTPAQRLLTELESSPQDLRSFLLDRSRL